MFHISHHLSKNHLVAYSLATQIRLALLRFTGFYWPFYVKDGQHSEGFGRKMISEGMKQWILVSEIAQYISHW